MSEKYLSVLNPLQWRYAVKKFDPTRKLPLETWEALEEALLLSPSAYGLQPWKFIVVQSPEIRRALKPFSHHQSQIEDCSHLLVFTSRLSIDERYLNHHVAQIARARNWSEERLSGYRKMVLDDVINGYSPEYQYEWTARQAYIALGSLVTSAAILGIDTCPMEGILPERYDEVLGLAGTGYRTLVACALGYRSVDDENAKFKKVRFEKETLFHCV